MPTYEFRCPDGHDFEKFYRSISSAESEVACPVCGKISERIMSRSGFAFKGSGFYLTDYGKNAHRGNAPESKPSEGASSPPSGESKSDTKSESKPESKSDSSPAPAPKSSESKPSTPPSKPSGSE